MRLEDREVEKGEEVSLRFSSNDFNQVYGYQFTLKTSGLEVVDIGKPETPFMSFGDTIRIEMLNDDDENIFGTIEQVIERYEP